MPFCPQCGAPNPPNAAFCGVCGAPIPARAPDQTATPAPVQTAPAPAPVAAAPPAQAQKPAGIDAKRTMLGFNYAQLQQPPVAPAAAPIAAPVAAPIPAPPAPVAPPAPAPVVPASPPLAASDWGTKSSPLSAPVPSTVHRTMLGFSPVADREGSSTARSPASAPLTPKVLPPQEHIQPLVRPGPTPVGKRTMMGFAAPATPPPAKQPDPPQKGKGQTMLFAKSPLAPGANPAAANPKASAKKTLMGMASPAAPGGMRRTLMGMPVPLLAPAEPEYVEEYYDEVVPETGEVERRVRLVEKPPPPLYKRPALYVIIAALALLVGGIGIAIIVKSPPPLTAEVRQDASRKDLLHVTCKGCPEGTTLTAPGGGKANVVNGESDLPMNEPLKVGENKLAIAIDRHGSGRDETVTLDVPIAYRIWPELAALQDPVPSVRIMIEALPGSTVTVQGKPVVLAADGTAASKVDVSDALHGLSKDVKTLDREIPYTIASQGSAPESGKLNVKIGILPLTLESPGARMVTDQPTFWLSGKSAKGSGLSVSGKAISVTKDGAFEQMMNISRVGSTEVDLRASAPSFAPRIATITVKRVESLAQEAKDIDAQPRATYADVLAKTDAAAGTPIGWKAEVVQSSVSGRQTIAVIEVSTGCAKKPCRARVTASNAPVLTTGDKLSVYGRVLGMTTGGPELPDVEADFVLKGP